MCMFKVETRFFDVNGNETTVDLPTLPHAWTREFEVKDNKAGRSAVAIALNHGNSRIAFKEVRKEAEDLGWVTRARNFQGIVFSDSAIEGTERFLVGYPRERLFTIPDEEYGGNWHVFPLSLGYQPEPETTADFATRFYDGDGFLMKSCEGSLTFAVYHEATEGSEAYWHVYGGGGSAYSFFMEAAISDAKARGVLIYEDKIPA